MRRQQLEHVLRMASLIADDPDVLVIGSQAIHGLPEDQPIIAWIRRRITRV